jgi:hypothetical protein
MERPYCVHDKKDFSSGCNLIPLLLNQMTKFNQYVYINMLAITWKRGFTRNCSLPSEIVCFLSFYLSTGHFRARVPQHSSASNIVNFFFEFSHPTSRSKMATFLSDTLLTGVFVNGGCTLLLFFAL